MDTMHTAIATSSKMRGICQFPLLTYSFDGRPEVIQTAMVANRQFTWLQYH